MNFILNLAILALLSFIQNMTFTAASRSRNSGDWNYHFKVALGSNGVWFITYFFIMKQVWEILQTGQWIDLMFVGVVYTLSTALGSRYMMKKMLQNETGKRKVGAR